MTACKSALRLTLLSALALLAALAWTAYGIQATESVAASAGAVAFPDLYEASIAELQDGLEKGHFTSVDLVKVTRPASPIFYVARLTVAHSRHTLPALTK